MDAVQRFQASTCPESVNNCYRGFIEGSKKAWKFLCEKVSYCWQKFCLLCSRISSALGKCCKSLGSSLSKWGKLCSVKCGEWSKIAARFIKNNKQACAIGGAIVGLVGVGAMITFSYCSSKKEENND